MVPELMAKLVPECWPTGPAAREWMRRERVTISYYKSIYYENVTLKFRRKGQRCPSWALSTVDVFDAWAELEKLTGKHVVECQRMDSPFRNKFVSKNYGVECQRVDSPPAQDVPAVNQRIDEPLPQNQRANLQLETPLIRRSTLYSRLMGGKPSTGWRPRPRIADPPDWRDLIPDPPPAFFPQPEPDYVGVMS